MGTSRTWAEEEFGAARLGDQRRTARGVELAARAAELPAGRITEVVQNEAEREGAFRFIRNERVSVEALASSSHDACVRRFRDELMIVAVDESSLALTDRALSKDLGPVGPGGGGRGLKVMTALAMSEDGSVRGVCGQRWWCRPDSFSPEWKKDRRSISERETSLWHDVIDDVEGAKVRAEGPARPWYQLDRGGDSWHVLLKAHEENLLLTVRAAYDRALDIDEQYSRMKQAVRAQKPMAVFDHYLRPSSAKRAGHSHLRARHLVVRARPITLKLTAWSDHKASAGYPIDVWVVHLREQRPPAGAKRLEWFLITTCPVDCAEDALKVAWGYSLRWKVEEFHKTWKSGACNVETSQLRSSASFRRWATILAAVAARIERLKHSARTQPDTPATEHATREEIDGAILLTKKCQWKPGDPLTIEQFVLLVAKIGGYTGKSSGGPPGSIVIGRGLDRVIAAATALTSFKEVYQK